MMITMIRSTGVVTIVASMFAAAAWGGEIDPTKPAPPPAAFAVCRGTVHVSGSSIGIGGPLKVDVYLSDIMPRGPINDEDIRFAFEKFLGDKYGQSYANEECVSASTLEEARRIRDVVFRKDLEGQKFIETGWKYTPPAKAAAPPPAHSAVCWSNKNARVKYYSAVFDGSRDDASKWWPAFQSYLKQKYGFDGPAQCIANYAETDARKYLQTLIDQDKKTRTMAGAPPEIVETGWKY